MSKLFRWLPGVLLLLMGSVLVSPTLAQTATPSDGCTTVDTLEATNSPVTLTGSSFLADEQLQFDISLPGTEATLTVTDADTATVVDTISQSPLPGSIIYTIPADGTYDMELVITDATVDTTTFGTCTPPTDTGDDGDDDDGDDDGASQTICHRPPGNPQAAHTITVGESAVDAHLGHGDSLGACPPGVDTKYTDYDINIVIFIIYLSNSISIHDDCEGDTCDTVVSVPISDIININDLVIVIENSVVFPDVDDPEEYEYEIDDDDDNKEIVLYYLHPDPDNPGVGVFQINVYENDTLISDNVLIFIDTDGNIILWTDQNYWAEQLAEATD